MTTPTFPENLPGPEVYTLGPMPQVLASGQSMGPRSFRNITRNMGGRASLVWKFTSEQFQAYMQFWRVDLLRGHKWFFVNLPSVVGNVRHVARFTKPHEYVLQGYNLWMVTADIEIEVRRIRSIDLDLYYTSDIYPLLNRDFMSSSIALDFVQLSPPIYVQENYQPQLTVDQVTLTTLLRNTGYVESTTAAFTIDTAVIVPYLFTPYSYTESLNVVMTINTVTMPQLLVKYDYREYMFESFIPQFTIDSASLT